MGGRNLNLMEFTDFDFNDLKTSGVCTIWLAQNIPIRGFRNGQIIVRMRSINLATGANLKFSLVTVAPTAEDPSKFYRNTSSGGYFPSAELTISGVITGGSNLLYQKDLTTDSIPLPSLVSLRMVVTQGTVDGALDFTTNVDLALKE